MFGIISTLLFGGKFVKESLEPTLPAEYHGNMKLEAEDAHKVAMGEITRKQFNQNIRNGKYYVPKQEKVLDPKKLKTYYFLRSLGTLNLEADFGEYNFIKDLTKEEAKEKYMEILAIGK